MPVFFVSISKVCPPLEYYTQQLYRLGSIHGLHQRCMRLLVVTKIKKKIRLLLAVSVPVSMRVCASEFIKTYSVESHCNRLKNFQYNSQIVINC